MPIRITMICQRCGCEIPDADVKTKYCDSCKKIIKHEQNIKWQQQNRYLTDEYYVPPTAINEDLNRVAKEANRMGMTYGQYVAWKRMKGV